MSAAAPTAGWPLPALVTSLSRAGWGEQLAGRPNAGLRTVLLGLEVRLPRGSAAGRVTEAQLADATGLSLRWVRRCLGALERLGLIEWRRGGIHAGRPRPSHIRVLKARLVDLILAARPDLAARVAQRAERTRERLAGLPAFLPTRRKASSRHEEVASSLSVLRRGSPVLPPAGEPAGVECRHGEPRGERYCALCRYASRTSSDGLPSR